MEAQNWQLTNPILGLAVVGATFLLFYIVGFLSNRKSSSAQDLYTGGGNVGAFTNGLAMASTYMSLATFLGITALILKLQVPFIMLWIQLILAIPLITIIYGTSLRRMGAFSPTHFIRDRYGVTASIIAALFMILVSVMYALGQMIGIAITFETLLGIPYLTGLFVFGIIIVGYITIGGMAGATNNAAIQMVIIALMFIIPLGAIMKAIGATGWYFPPLFYADMVPAMMDALPTFFDYQFSTKWYFSIIPALTIGALGLPHLAMRVYTASNLKSARSAMVWFAFILGLVFSATYAMGFVGVYATTTQGLVISEGDADKLTIILNLVYNPEWVTALVIAGAISAGLSTLSGNLLAIGALISQDIIATLKPNIPQRLSLRIGFVAIFAGGLLSILLAIEPPAFLVVSILWAFGLAGVTNAPLIIVGVWWKEANKFGAIAASIGAGAIYIIVSPFVFPSIVLTGHAVTDGMGLSGAMLAVPISFILLIVVSYITNRMPSLQNKLTKQSDIELIERIHGWKDIKSYRYNSVLGAGVTVVVSAAVAIWALMPWGM
ncbi:Acetate permease ActP (cation/acetate symporter) [Planococcus halocryophilus Or1]|uniref:Sodium:solute symporter n=1 Tax=Planococcus halocryophilus TaxID=1215089 RepID=A0A1C7DSG9_9BACL|nr:acetate permease [Planococcus halocryophilus]ANU14143.1 sodium:solute symporter [Planococcus halocryophilus]EMF47261.1 Acetate permease ActP (cation/acetate symporter) [Planococcus halocryophilus Or1]